MLVVSGLRDQAHLGAQRGDLPFEVALARRRRARWERSAAAACAISRSRSRRRARFTHAERCGAARSGGSPICSRTWAGGSLIARSTSGAAANSRRVASSRSAAIQVAACSSVPLEPVVGVAAPVVELLLGAGEPVDVAAVVLGDALLYARGLLEHAPLDGPGRFRGAFAQRRGGRFGGLRARVRVLAVALEGERFAGAGAVEARPGGCGAVALGEQLVARQAREAPARGRGLGGEHLAALGAEQAAVGGERVWDPRVEAGAQNPAAGDRRVVSDAAPNV